MLVTINAITLCRSAWIVASQLYWSKLCVAPCAKILTTCENVNMRFPLLYVTPRTHLYVGGCFQQIYVNKCGLEILSENLPTGPYVTTWVVTGVSIGTMIMSSITSYNYVYQNPNVINISMNLDYLWVNETLWMNRKYKKALHLWSPKRYNAFHNEAFHNTHLAE